MARVTVEDCVLRIPNRFDLVLVAAQRAREISSGAVLTLDRDNDKNPVVSLREIAEGNTDPEALMESLIRDHQKHVEVDEPVEEEIDLLAIQQELLNGGSESASSAGVDLEAEIEAGIEGDGPATQDDGEGASEGVSEIGEPSSEDTRHDG